MGCERSYGKPVVLELQIVRLYIFPKTGILRFFVGLSNDSLYQDEGNDCAIYSEADFVRHQVEVETRRHRVGAQGFKGHADDILVVDGKSLKLCKLGPVKFEVEIRCGI